MLTRPEEGGPLPFLRKFGKIEGAKMQNGAITFATFAVMLKNFRLVRS